MTNPKSDKPAKTNWRKRSEQQAQDILVLEAELRRLNRRVGTLTALLNTALERDATDR